MKVAILAGGLGSRLAEETAIRPKPMVEIGGMPMLWHIMKIYDHWGYHDFCIALGYKGDYIKRWFRDYYTVSGSMTVNTSSGKVIDYPDARRPEWNVDLVETGENTMTGGRIKRLGPWLGNDTALVTWGDGVADINIPRLLDIPSFAWKACDDDGGPSAGALWPSGTSRGPDHAFHGKAADRRGLD